MENQVTQRVEAAVRNITGVDEVNSTVSEGGSRTMVRVIVVSMVALSLIYLLVNLCVVLAMRKLENHLRLPGYIGSASNAPQAGH